MQYLSKTPKKYLFQHDFVTSYEVGHYNWMDQPENNYMCNLTADLKNKLINRKTMLIDYAI